MFLLKKEVRSNTPDLFLYISTNTTELSKFHIRQAFSSIRQYSNTSDNHFMHPTFTNYPSDQI